MPENFSLHESSRWRVMLAFAAIYLIWGSTYFAIHVAIETMPPFFMAGMRFLGAGGILYLWMRLRGAPAPKRVHWIAATAIGGLLLLGGNGGVVWAEQYVPTGLAALLIATVPFWMVLLDWLRRDGKRPNAGVIVGLGLGFIGMTLLVSQNGIASASRVDPVGALALIIASLSWASGSLTGIARSRWNGTNITMVTIDHVFRVVSSSIH
jgi:drug/metabolite transporter (DMT)-like permease